MQFRLLRADEIDCRISTCNQWGVGLLLYKDARCDQNILDETVGPMNWQRHHSRDNANCTVSIWDDVKKQWIEKEDTGKESFTEAEKGLASDSFKRACFNWGIGRELYTAPNMFIKAEDLKTLKEEEWQGRKKWGCKDTFTVTDIEYSEGKIVFVKVLNNKTNSYIEFGKTQSAVEEQKQPVKTEEQKAEEEQKKIENSKISEVKLKALLKRCADDHVDTKKLMQLYKVNSLADLTERQFANMHEHWEKIKG